MSEPLQKIRNLFAGLAKPWRENLTFFFWMILLGLATAWLTVPNYRGARVYDLLFIELFFDVSCLCVVLWAVGRVVRPWLRGFFYIVAYATALVDVYCFHTYDTTLTPTVMILLAETNSREAGEFLQSLFSWNLITGRVGVILLIIVAHVGSSSIIAWLHRRRGVKFFFERTHWIHACQGLLFMAAFLFAGSQVWENKNGVYKLLSAGNIGEIEHLLTEKVHGEMYQPVYRLAFSAYANSLTAQQVDKLKRVVDVAEVDSCSFRSPEIVVIFGESFSRHHSQQYGYWQKTTPRQVEMEQSGRLVKFSDVVSPWNLTSFVFKLMLSTYVVGDSGEWCDYPLFPVLFRKAGYHVTFLTNQFLPKAREAVYDFSGGFFLNDAELSAAQFDVRNERLHRFDEELINDYRRLAPQDSMRGRLTIFQLMGQHVMYAQRSPNNWKLFKKEDYKQSKPHLNNRERRILSDYDNAVLYNDSVVHEICKLFDDREAIVLYVPDHGEECYEGNLHFFCRMHSAEITSRLAHAEFDIPFWIYTTDKYRRRNPDICREIEAAKDKRYMTDALPHLLLYIAGIHTDYYRKEYNILSPEYNEMRPRLLKNTTDYDTLD